MNSEPDHNEPELRAQTLSPVSPKPIHFPQPSNIPILENQMDASLNDSINYAGPAQENHTSVKEEPGGGNQFASYQDRNGGIVEENMDTRSLEQHEPQNHIPMAMDENHTEPNNKQTFSSDSPFISNETSNVGANLNDTSLTLEDDSILPDTNASDVIPREQDQTSSVESRMGDVQPDSTGQVNLQALLNNLSSSTSTVPSPADLSVATSNGGPSPAGDSPSQTTTAVSPDATPSASALPSVPGLPPRPPVQDNPTSNVTETELRSLHFHNQPSQKNASSSGVGASIHPPGNVPPPMPSAGAPGTSFPSANFPPPSLTAFQNPSQSGPSSAQSPSSTAHMQDDGSGFQEIDQGLTEDDRRWDPEVQRKYDAFLEDERMYVTKGEWDKFPTGSRLFLGNLPTEKVTKRDLFHVFHKFGKLAQVSIKQAYGFIQFLQARDCARALQAEQGVLVRGKKIHLEISKPQKNLKNHNHNQNQNRHRRSRSPDFKRGQHGGNARNADQYRNDGQRQMRMRDDYRPARSPSPHRSHRTPDRYSRRRSRSPYDSYRNQTPRSEIEDDFPLPRRPPHEVPDVQIIIKEDVDRAFIDYVERTLESRGLKKSVFRLIPRYSESSFIRRQIIEGVLAVMKLDKHIQFNQKFQLSVFARTPGDSNVRFEEYTNQTLDVCVELVFRAKQNSNQAVVQYSQYGLPLVNQPSRQTPKSQPQYPSWQQSQQQAQVRPETQTQNHNQASLQQLLSSVQPPNSQQNSSNYQSHQQYSPSSGFPSSDLSRLLASANAGSQRPNQQYPAAQNQQRPPSQNQFPPNINTAYGGPQYFGNLNQQPPTPNRNQPQPGQPSVYQPQQHSPVASEQPDMGNIMAMLGRYKR